MSAVAMTVNGKAVTADVDPRTLLVQFLRENLRLTGHPCGLRHLAVRRLRRACGRQGGESPAPSSRWQARRRQRAHHRGARRAERPAASDAGGLPREPRPAVRLLHARHDHDRGRHGPPQGQRPRRPRPSATSSKAICAAAPAITTSSRRSRPAPRPWPREAGTQASANRAAVARRPGDGGDRHERDRDRRGGAPQGRPPLHHRQGPVHRRRQSSGPRPRLFPALAACARQDQEHRRQGGGGAAGRARGAHRRRARRRQDRQSDLRLDDPLQGRLADEDGAASGDRAWQGVLCRRSGRGGGRRDAWRRRKDAAEKIKVDYEVLPAVVDPAKAQARARRRSTRSRRATPSTSGTSATRRRPTPRSSRRSTSPSSTSSTTAWCRTRWSRAPRSANTMPATTASRSGTRRRTRTSRGSSSPPSSAWRPSTSCA